MPDYENILTSEGVAVATPFETPIGEAATAAAAPLAAAFPAPRLLDLCRSQAAALDGVDVDTRDRKNFLSALRLAIASHGPDRAGPGALLLLTGPAQSGTSTILQRGLGLLPKPAPKGAWTLNRPVLKLTLDEETSFETLIWMMTDALDPEFGSATAAAKIDPQRDGRRLRKLLREFEVEWLVLDRADGLVADDLVDRRSADFLGKLRGSGDRPINLILCGRDPAAKLVAQTPELAVGAISRLTHIYTDANEAEFVSFVGAILDRTALPAKSKSSVLGEREFRQRLIDETEGLRGHLQSLGIQAVMIAASSRAAPVTKEHFEKALAGGFKSQPARRLLPPDATAKQPKPKAGRSKRSKRRQ